MGVSNHIEAKAVLFDLDGTLLDTADDLGGALNSVLKEYNLPQVSPSKYYSEASNGAMALLAMGFGSEFTRYCEIELRQKFLDYYQKDIARNTRFFSEIENLINWLNDQNIPWGIVTNKPEFLTFPLLSHFPLFSGAKVAVCGDTLSVAKPAPEPMWLAAEKMSVSNEDIIYLGDAKRDIEAGKNAGMKTAVVNWGYIAEGECIASWQADVLLTSPNELKSFIKQPNGNH